VKHQFGLLLVVLVAGCAVGAPSIPAVDTAAPLTSAEAQARRDLLVGTWYGSQPTVEGGRAEEIAVLRHDGTFEIYFRRTDAAGNVTSFGDAGLWGLVRDIHFTITLATIEDELFLPVDTSEAALYSAYRVIELTESGFVYESLVTGNVYALDRVDDQFELPD
jgi:hypothetical protein